MCLFSLTISTVSFVNSSPSRSSPSLVLPCLFSPSSVVSIILVHTLHFNSRCSFLAYKNYLFPFPTALLCSHIRSLHFYFLSSLSPFPIFLSSPHANAVTFWLYLLFLPVTLVLFPSSCFIFRYSLLLWSPGKLSANLHPPCTFIPSSSLSTHSCFPSTFLCISTSKLPGVTHPAHSFLRVVTCTLILPFPLLHTLISTLILSSFVWP